MSPGLRYPVARRLNQSFFYNRFPYQVLLLTFLLDVLTNPQNIMAESVMIQLGSTFTECSKSRHLRSVEKD